MQKLSDMMWAMWEYYIPAAQRPGIDFVMSLGINNPETMAIIRRAMDSAGSALSTTPFRLDPMSDGGLVLLGMLPPVCMRCGAFANPPRLPERRERRPFPHPAQEPNRTQDRHSCMGVRVFVKLACAVPYVQRR